MNSIFVRAVKMPITLRAFTLPDADGNLTSISTRRFLTKQRKKALSTKNVT